MTRDTVTKINIELEHRDKLRSFLSSLAQQGHVPIIYGMCIKLGHLTDTYDCKADIDRRYHRDGYHDLLAAVNEMIDKSTARLKVLGFTEVDAA